MSFSIRIRISARSIWWHTCWRVADHLASSYGKNAVECRVSGASIVLNLEKAISCGLIVNELVSNSFKHAFPNGAAGAIDVEVRHERGWYRVG